MAMLKFAQKMVAGQPIEIYNHGDLERDFTYIDDIVAGFVLALQQPQPYEIINLGNGAPVKLMDFITALETELGVVAEQQFLPMQQGDVYSTYADTTKAKALLGFTARTPFADGVRAFVDWFKSYYQS